MLTQRGHFSPLWVASSSWRLLWLPHLSDSGQHSQVVEAEAARFREVSILEVTLHHLPSLSVVSTSPKASSDSHRD